MRGARRRLGFGDRVLVGSLRGVSAELSAVRLGRETWLRPGVLDRFWGTSMLEIIRAISHSLRARLFAAALLLPLIALATVTSGVGLRCRITGEMLSACCCDGGDNAAAKTAPVATVSEADCCDRVVRDVTTAPAELTTTPSVLPDQTTPIAHVAVEAPAVVLPSSVFSSRSETRARVGSPTVLLRLVSKSSFLL